MCGSGALTLSRKDYALDHQIRAAAAAYLASFTARFAPLHPEAVAASLATLAAWSGEYVDRQSQGALAMVPDLKTHYLFYVVCNCVFYVLCFRPACAAPSLRPALAKVLGCGLNPLLFVLGGIRDELVAVEGVDRVLDTEAVQRKMADNRRLLVASNIEFAMEFPFDPYLLPRGEMRLAEFYQSWEGEEDQDVDEEDDGNGESSEGEDDSECVAMSLGTPVMAHNALTGGSLTELQKGEVSFQSYSSGNNSPNPIF